MESQSRKFDGQVYDLYKSGLTKDAAVAESVISHKEGYKTRATQDAVGYAIFNLKIV
jgi:hypothetical protein